MGVLCTWAKLLTDLQILGCELHKNAFNGRAPPGPAEGAILLGIESASLSEDEYEDKMTSRILANNRQKTSDDGTCFFLHVTSIFSLLLQLLLSAERRKLGACCFNATRMCDGGGAVQYVWTTDEINSISQFETRPGYIRSKRCVNRTNGRVDRSRCSALSSRLAANSRAPK